MSRSVWKGPFARKIFKKIKQQKTYNCWTRSTMILPAFLGTSLKVHNGRFFVLIKVTSSMIGYKVGNFIFTRKKFVYNKQK